MIHRSNVAPAKPDPIEPARAAAVLRHLLGGGRLIREQQAAIRWVMGQADRIEELEREVLALKIELGAERQRAKALEISRR